MKTRFVLVVLAVIALSGAAVGVVLNQRESEQPPDPADVVEQASKEFEARFQNGEGELDAEAQKALDGTDWIDSN